MDTARGKVDVVAPLPVVRRRLLAVRVRHRLRPHERSFRIEEKRVHLIDSDEVIDNLTFLV